MQLPQWCILMRLCLYNPMVAQTAERSDEISIALGDAQAILGPGTCRRRDTDVDVSRRVLGKHVEYSWGWQRYADKSAGVSIYLAKRLAKETIVKRVFSPPFLRTPSPEPTPPSPQRIHLRGFQISDPS